MINAEYVHIDEGGDVYLCTNDPEMVTLWKTNGHRVIARILKHDGVVDGQHLDNDTQVISLNNWYESSDDILPEVEIMTK